MTAIPVTPQNAVDYYAALRGACQNIRFYCTEIQTQSAGAGVPVATLLTLQAGATQALATFAAIGGATTSVATAIQNYVQSIYGDVTLDVISDAQASATALQALAAAVLKDIPVDAAGNVQLQTLNSTTGALSPVLLTAAKLPNTLPAITAWLATIS